MQIGKHQRNKYTFAASFLAFQYCSLNSALKNNDVNLKGNHI